MFPFSVEELLLIIFIRNSVFLLPVITVQKYEFKKRLQINTGKVINIQFTRYLD